MDHEKLLEFNKLVSQTSDFCCNKLKYSNYTMKFYHKCWDKIYELMLKHNISVIDDDSVSILLKKIGYYKKGNRHVATNIYYLSRSLKMLLLYKKTNSVPLVLNDSQNDLLIPFSNYLNDFLIYLKLKQRRNNITISAYKRNIIDFLNYLSKEGLDMLENLDITYVVNYIRDITPKSGTTPFLAIGNIRGFLKFLHETNITSNDISAQMPRCKRILQPRLPSTYSIEEVKKALCSIERITGIGKRNYAIFITIARIGLRVSDIIRLRFCNLFWRESKIKIMQYKTGNPLILDIPADVGNAIIDYLKYGRSPSNDDHVFLMERAAVPMNNTAIYNIINKAFKNAGINTIGKHKGAHALRHSLSSRMFENNVAIPIITQVLGHENGESTNYYLRIDLKSMSHCMLDVSNVNPMFYKKMEEIFYVYLQ